MADRTPCVISELDDELILCTERVWPRNPGRTAAATLDPDAYVTRLDIDDETRRWMRRHRTRAWAGGMEAYRWSAVRGLFGC